MKKRIFIICLFVFVVFGFGVIYFRNNVDSQIENTVFFQLITAVTALFGVLGLIFQSDRTKDLDEAHFIFELNQQYITNKKFQNLLDLLKTNSSDSFPTDIDDVLAQYFDFFEPIYIFVKKDILSIKLIDDLFCFRFFAVVNNQYVQDKVLTPHKMYYGNIVKLHYIWKKYRLKRKKAIPFLHSDLSLVSWYNVFFKIDNNSNNNNFTIDNVKVREANCQDVEYIIKLYFQLLGKYATTVDLREKIKSIKQDDRNYILVAAIGRKIVGTVQCSLFQTIAFNGRPNMTIDYFIVEKNYRNIGIGSLLFNYVEQIAKRNNVKSIFLVSSNSLKKAHKFYKKLGFDSNVNGFRMDKR